MLENKIQNLINYAKYHLELNELDEIYIRNRLLEIMKEENFSGVTKELDIKNMNCPDIVVDSLVEEAINRNIICESEKEYFISKLMDTVSKRPSEIISKFNNLYTVSPMIAFEWLHRYNIMSDYIKSTHISKNIKWVAEETSGKLEITINLSKPEKSNSEVKKAATTSINYPKCVICPENVGYSGHNTFRQNLRGIPLKLGNEKWFWQFSPYAYFNQHGIAINDKHTPMTVDSNTPGKLLDFVDYIPNYFIGCNAALPIIGGSILAHDHFQGGKYVMPMFKSKTRRKFMSITYPTVAISILEWYNSVIHLESTNRTELEELSKEIINSWKEYSDDSLDIIAHTTAQHNSITVVAQKHNNTYSLDMILRNNRTSEEHPEGIFHAHQEYFNIKSEGIGLIEAMGFFILPARLKRQLMIIEEFLCENTYNSNELSDDMKIHSNMIERLIKLHGVNNTREDANKIIQSEINRICECILDNTAVYKNNKLGQEGFIRFLKSLNIKEV